MSIRQAYSEWASSYDTDRNLTRDLDQTVTAQYLAGKRYETVVEPGCGTGKNTASLADIAARVLALDFSRGMLAQARTKVAAENVSFIVADLTLPWPLAGGGADLVICNLVLEHIADLAFVFGEAHRVLVNGGRLFVCELHPFRQYQGKRATFDRGQVRTEIAAYIHDISDFLAAAASAGFALTRLAEWRHPSETDALPRLVAFDFVK